jgi:uncharacterized caspase-like protein
MRAIPGLARRLARGGALASRARVAAATLLLVLGAAPSDTIGVPRSGDELLVVDCLLPGQIRKLGQRTTYVSARRPLKTTARDCQIRGGEYAAYDRATLQSALEVWLPSAKEGDAEAGTIVGEIFERGIGSTPDFVAAAEWYRRASAQGSTRAQVNLGHLYEKGLGVTRNPAEALRWYRRAAGLETAIELDSGPGPAELDNEALRREVEKLRGETQTLTHELDRMRRELEAAASPGQRTSDVPSVSEIVPPPPADVAPVDPTPQLQQEVDSLGQQLAAAAAEIQRLTQLLAQSNDQIHAAQAELEQARQEHTRQLQSLAESNATLEEQRRAAADGEARLAALAAALKQRESEMDGQRAEAEQLRAELARLQRQLASQDSQLEALVEPVQVTVRAATAGPEISIIEPQLLGTRDIVLAAAPVGTTANREIIGRVTAAAGLLNLTLNGERVQPNEHGVFAAQVPFTPPQTSVNVVAIDRQGKRAVVSFSLQHRVPAPALAATAAAAPVEDYAGIDFGRYHALVIGNNDYQHLRDLRSAVGDAESVAAVLGGRYGFRTRLLTNANRYAILSALNDLREQLTAEDNLLIYYAGHGVLDEVNNRGNWLPVDAEAESSANWIPTTAVTDILNIMKARQVLVVVDSCYAGALTRSSVARLATATTGEERLHWLRAVSGKRARVVLTSGGIAPVLDSGGGAHSVFAKALLEVLDNNVELLDGQRLFREVAARVSFAAGNVGFDQVPEYAPIRYAGHEAGEFFFVPSL